MDTLFVVEIGHTQAIVAAPNLWAARSQAFEDWGRQNVTGVRIATKEDVSWQQSMGGAVPKGSLHHRAPNRVSGE